MYLLIGFGIFILLLFLAGAYHTVSEFNEMDEHPESYHKDTDHLDTKRD